MAANVLLMPGLERRGEAVGGPREAGPPRLGFPELEFTWHRLLHAGTLLESLRLQVHTLAIAECDSRFYFLWEGSGSGTT